MKAGFSLLELMISLMITAIIGVVLTTFLNQTTTTQAGLGRLIDAHKRAVVVVQQLERDIMGTCMPIQNSMQKKKDTKTESAQPAQQTPQSAQTSQQTEEKKKESVKPVEHVFYCEQSKEQLKLFTVVTTNPLQVYWSKQLGKPKPKIARVVYTLVPDPEEKTSFILMRQEGEDLDLKNYTAKTESSTRRYEVIDGVKSLVFRFTVFNYQNQEQQKEQPKNQTQTSQQKSPQKRERTVEQRDTWDWPLEKESDTKETEPSPFPHFVTITLELWDEGYERTETFEYTIPVMIDAIPEPEKKQTESAPAAQQNNQRQQQGQGSTQATQQNQKPETPIVFIPFPLFNINQRM